MDATRIILGRTEVSKGWRIALFALMGLVGAAALAILLGGPRSVAHAGSDSKIDPWPSLEIACLETLVEEGEEVRLEVRATQVPDWLYARMRVFWYTEAITADASDYKHLQGVQQESTWEEADLGAMGRDFRTLEDNYPEIDETFRVRFENDNEHGTDGRCTITIADDDGVGIYALEITSEPGEVMTESGDTVRAYSAGDVIEITAHFTGAVTTLNPETGERADYAGLYIQVGKNRRLAKLLRGDGSDIAVFGYTVTEDDEDADGISVEGGGSGTGMHYNEGSRDGGIWAARAPGGRLNRIFHGLDDDPDHAVVKIKREDGGDDDEDDQDADGDGEQTGSAEPIISTPTPEPGPWAERASAIRSNLRGMSYGELTGEDGGRDWFSFEGGRGESYIIELKSMLDVSVDDAGHIAPFYAAGHLVDPSILEVVDEYGEQVLGEHDGGGFIGKFARAFFAPDDDGSFYIAVGAGREDRTLLGHYELSVRVDDNADDFRTGPGSVLRPGKSVTGKIDSDVASDDPGLNPWDWTERNGLRVPTWGFESLDDRDVFRFEIDEEGAYRLKVSGGPEDVGIWRIAERHGNIIAMETAAPVESLQDNFRPGTYYVEVGTPFASSGNTETYTLVLTRG